MKQLLKKIYTILILIKNVLIRKSEYNLHFVAEKDGTTILNIGDSNTET